jgi:hypothetical protein
MRSAADIAELRAVAAKHGTSSADTEAVLDRFSKLKSDKMQATFALKHYAKHPIGRASSSPANAAAPARSAVVVALQSATRPGAVAVASSGPAAARGDDEQLASSIVSGFLDRKSTKQPAQVAATAQTAVHPRPAARNAEERLADQMVDQYLGRASADGGSERHQARTAEERFAGEAVKQYLAGKGSVS